MRSMLGSTAKTGKMTSEVAAAFAALVLVRELWIRLQMRNRRVAACQHHFREPFAAMGIWHRNCCCCDLQQHSDDGKTWK